jgi:hypothetical protein
MAPTEAVAATRMLWSHSPRSFTSITEVERIHGEQPGIGKVSERERREWKKREFLIQKKIQPTHS